MKKKILDSVELKALLITAAIQLFVGGLVLVVPFNIFSILMGAVFSCLIGIIMLSFESILSPFLSSLVLGDKNDRI